MAHKDRGWRIEDGGWRIADRLVRPLSSILSENYRPTNSALIGGVVWVGAVLIVLPNPFHTAWAKVLLMLAPLVLVPLGLRLVRPQGTPGVMGWLWRIVIALQLP